MFIRLARNILDNMNKMDEEAAREYLIEEANEHRTLRFVCRLVWAFAWGMFGFLTALHIFKYF